MTNIISFNRTDGRELPDEIKDKIKQFRDSINAPKKESNITQLKKPVNLHPEKGRDIEGQKMHTRHFPKTDFTEDDLYEMINMLDYMIDGSGRHNFNQIAKIIHSLLTEEAEIDQNDIMTLTLSGDEYVSFQHMMVSNAKEEQHYHSPIARKILLYIDRIEFQENPKMIEEAKNDPWLHDTLKMAPWERFF